MAMRLDCPICLNSLFEPCSSGEGELGQGGEEDRNGQLGPGQLSTEFTTEFSEALNLSLSTSFINGRPRRVNKALLTELAGKAKETAAAKVKKYARARSEYFNGARAGVTPCGHLFHALCLDDWCKEVAGLATCPNCRKLFDRTKVISVFMESSKPSAATSSCQKLAQFNGRGPSVSVNPVDDSSDEDVDAAPSPSTSARRAERERDIADINPTSYAGSNLQDFKHIHETLITDFNGLKTKYYDLKDEHDRRGAMIMSLEHTQKQLEEKLRKYEDDESPPPDTTPRPSPAQAKREVTGSGPGEKRRKH